MKRLAAFGNPALAMAIALAAESQRQYYNDGLLNIAEDYDYRELPFIFNELKDEAHGYNVLDAIMRPALSKQVDIFELGPVDDFMGCLILERPKRKFTLQNNAVTSNRKSRLRQVAKITPKKGR